MIHDGTHNVGPGHRRMCECCEQRPAKVGFMCAECYGAGQLRPPPSFPPIRPARAPSKSPYADKERTKWRCETLGLPLDTPQEDVDEAWRERRVTRKGATWVGEPVTLDAEDR